MASTQRFDGPNLETVLAEVQAAHGDGARILNAHKVRTGGIGGFFAKERFEVDVEVTGDDPAVAGTEPWAGGVVEAEEPLAFSDDGPASILELADGVSARESGGPPAPATSPFAAVLAARFAEQARAAAAAVPVPEAEPEPEPPVADEVVEEAPRPGLRIVPDLDPEPDADTAHPSAWEPFVPAAAPAWPAPALAAAAPAMVATTWPEPAPAPPAPARPEPAPAAPVPVPVAPARPEPAPAAPVPVPALTPVPVPVPAAPPAPAPRPAPAAGDAVTAALFRRGLPLALLPEAPVADPRAALVAALDRLPEVPEVAAGRSVVIAVVGERDEALALARRIAAERGVEPADVVLASPTYRGRRVAAWNRLATAEEAESERRSWRRRSHATVVAVESAVDGFHTEWAGAVLAALEPHLTWAVVHAGHKTEDMAWWLDRLGGVDALAVEGTRRTVTPAGVLALGLPVGLLDGEPASPGRWADVLLPEVAR